MEIDCQALDLGCVVQPRYPLLMPHDEKKEILHKHHHLPLCPLLVKGQTFNKGPRGLAALGCIEAFFDPERRD